MGTKNSHDKDKKGSWSNPQIRLINISHETWIEYFSLFLIGMLPIFISYLIGADKNFPSQCKLGENGDCFQGYLEWSNLNWLHYPISLPFSLFLFRWISNNLYNFKPHPILNEPDSPKKFPFTLIERFFPSNRKYFVNELFPEKMRASAGKKFQDSITSSNIFYCVLIGATALQIIDMMGDLKYYTNYLLDQTLFIVSDFPDELDWAVFFLIQKKYITSSIEMSSLKNLSLLLSAYFCQYIIIFLGLMFITIFFKFNCLYLNLIYRRNREEGLKDCYIEIDFHDDANRFGLRPINNIFNIQIGFLIFSGCIIASSRVANLPFKQSKLILEFFTTEHFSKINNWGSTLFELISLFKIDLILNDIGQVFLILAWPILFIILMLPMAVKFLPILRKHILFIDIKEYVTGGSGRKEYLEQFIPKDSLQWTHQNIKDKTPMEKVDFFSTRFRDSAFWPTGDPNARKLFGWSFSLFFYLILPLSPNQGPILSFLGFVVFILLLGKVTQVALYKILNGNLKKIDQSLVRDGG
jgi:hypothetical protein